MTDGFLWFLKYIIRLQKKIKKCTIKNPVEFSILMYFVLPSKFIFSECFRCCHPMTFYSLDLIVVEAENTHARCMYSKKSQDFGGIFFSELICIFHPSFHLKGFTRYKGKLHSSVNIKSKNDMWKILWFWSNSQNVKASRKPFEFWLKKLTFSGNSVDPWLCPPSSWLYKLSLLVP